MSSFVEMNDGSPVVLLSVLIAPPFPYLSMDTYDSYVPIMLLACLKCCWVGFDQLNFWPRRLWKQACLTTIVTCGVAERPVSQLY